MISPSNQQVDAVAPATPAMDFEETLIQLIQSVVAPTSGNPTPDSTPFVGDYDTMHSIDELLTSPEFTSPLFEDTPNLSDASPFTPSSSSTQHQTSPALFDDSDASWGGVPLFGPNPIVVSPSQQNSLPDEPPTSLAIDTQALFSPTLSPLPTTEHSKERPAEQRPASDPVPTTKRSRPTGHRKNLQPDQLLSVDAPTQQRNYYGPSTTSRKAIPAGFDERRTKIVAKRRRGLGTDGEELSEESILNAAIEDKRRANTIAARRSRQRKLEHVKQLEEELEEAKRAMELWKERAIAAEGMVRQLEGKE